MRSTAWVPRGATGPVDPDRARRLAPVSAGRSRSGGAASESAARTPALWLPIRSSATSGAKRQRPRGSRPSSRRAPGRRPLRHCRRRTTSSSSRSGWPASTGAIPSSTTQPIFASGRCRRRAVSTGRAWTTSPRALVRTMRIRASHPPARPSLWRSGRSSRGPWDRPPGPCGRRRRGPSRTRAPARASRSPCPCSGRPAGARRAGERGSPRRRPPRSRPAPAPPAARRARRRAPPAGPAP